MKKYKFDNLTENQLDMIKNPELTVAELSELWGFGSATIHRWRRTLGVNLGRGSKKGKPRPWQEKKENRTCPECQEVFQTTPAATKIYCSLGCSTKNIDRSYMQSESYRSSLIKDETPEYRKYSGRVHRLTAKIYESAKYIINPNDYPRGLAGQDGVYHLDHIVSIRYGFDNNIPPEEIAKVENLQMLPWKENISKGK